MATPSAEFTESLQRHGPEFGVDLQANQLELLAAYYELLLKWNSRLHLVAPCSPTEFAVRHVLESLVILKHLPAGVAVADVGSGGGLPMLPCLLAREDLRATLVESSKRKGAFLREALRIISLPGRAELKVARFQEIPSPQVDFLTCRALDRFGGVLPDLVRWALPSTTFLLFTGESLRHQVKLIFPSLQEERIPRSEQRFLLIARREA